MNALYENIEYDPVTRQDIAEASRRVTGIVDGLTQIVKELVADAKDDQWGRLHVVSCCLAAIDEEVFRILPNNEVKPS